MRSFVLAGLALSSVAVPSRAQKAARFEHAALAQGGSELAQLVADEPRAKTWYCELSHYGYNYYGARSFITRKGAWFDRFSQASNHALSEALSKAYQRCSGRHNDCPATPAIESGIGRMFGPYSCHIENNQVMF